MMLFGCSSVLYCVVIVVQSFFYFNVFDVVVGVAAVDDNDDDDDGHGDGDDDGDGDGAVFVVHHIET